MLTVKKSAFVLLILLVMTLLCSFLPATAFAGELHRVNRLEVVDANGKLVGEVIDMSYVSGGNPLLAFKKEGKVFMVGVTPFTQSFTGFFGGSLYYESTDCSGAPLLNSNPSFVLNTVVNPPGMTVYVPDTSVIPQQVNLNSYLPEVGTGGVCNTYSFTDFMVPAVPVVDLASMFTPPFSVHGH